MRAFAEEIDVHLTEHRTEGIGILLSPRFPEMALHFQYVVEWLLGSAQHGLKKTVRMNLAQREPAVLVRRIDDRNFCCIRTKNASEPASLKFPNSQEFERIEMAGFDQWIEIIVGNRRGIHDLGLTSYV